MAFDNFKKQYSDALTKAKETTYQRAANAIDDIKTMSKFLVSPSGVMFTLKQTGMQIMSPRLDNTVQDRLRLYNPTFPLLAVTNNVLPIKPGVYRHLALPGFDKPNYERVKWFTNNNSGFAVNKLIPIGLETGNIVQVNQKTNVQFYIPDNIAVRLPVHTGKTEIKLLRDVAGPDSFYGIGGTKYFQYPTSNRDDNYEIDKISRYEESIYSDPAKRNSRVVKTDAMVREYIGNVGTDVDQFYQLSVERRKQWEKEYNTNNPNKKIDTYQKYSNPDSKFGTKKKYEVASNLLWENVADDKVPVYFVPNNNTNDTIRVRAFISNLSFNFAANWSATKYVGRPEEFNNYESNNRTFKFNLKIASFNKEELLDNIKKIDKLVQYTYAKNIDNSLSGMVIYVTIGKLIKSVPCILMGVPVTIDDNTTWDIDEGIPMHYELSFDFKVVGKSSPYYGNKFFN